VRFNVDACHRNRDRIGLGTIDPAHSLELEPRDSTGTNNKKNLIAAKLPTSEGWSKRFGGTKSGSSSARTGEPDEMNIAILSHPMSLSHNRVVPGG
jgi:hypothetical protein